MFGFATVTALKRLEDKLQEHREEVRKVTIDLPAMVATFEDITDKLKRASARLERARERAASGGGPAGANSLEEIRRRRGGV